jgi:hypothetical protein
MMRFDMGGNVLRLQERASLSLEDKALALLMREDASWYVSLAQSVFEVMTERVERSELISRLIDCADVMLREDRLPNRYRRDDDKVWEPEELAQDFYSALLTPTESGYGYGWIREDVDTATKFVYVTLSLDAHRAIDLLDRIATETRTFTGARVDDLKSQYMKLHVMVSEDPEQRLQMLRAQIAPILAEIERLEAGEDVQSYTTGEIIDVMDLILSLLSPMPAAVHRVAQEERDACVALQREYVNLDLPSTLLMSRYVDDLSKRSRESEDGKSFRRAQHVICDDMFDEGLKSALAEVKGSHYLSPGILELARSIEERADAVRRELWAVNDARLDTSKLVERISRRNRGGRYREKIRDLNLLSAYLEQWRSEVKGRNPLTGVSLPYGGVRRSRYMSETVGDWPSETPVALAKPSVPDDGAAFARAVLRQGGPRIHHCLARILDDPVMDGDLVDVAASFARLDADDQLVQEMGGLICRFGSGSRDVSETWTVYDSFGDVHHRIAAPLRVNRGVLVDIVERASGHASD